MRRAALLGSAMVLLLAGSGAAGNYGGPFGDCCPEWSPGGTQILFHRSGSNGVGVFGLHVWLWRNNPAGLFAESNPNVSCGAE